MARVKSLVLHILHDIGRGDHLFRLRFGPSYLREPLTLQVQVPVSFPAHAVISLVPSPHSVISLVLSPRSVISLVPSPRSVISLVPSPCSVISLVPSPCSAISLVPSPRSVISLVPSPRSVISLVPSPRSVISLVPSPRSVISLVPSPRSVMRWPGIRCSCTQNSGYQATSQPRTQAFLAQIFNLAAMDEIWVRKAWA